MRPPMADPPHKGRFRKPYPSRHGGAGDKAERDRKHYDHDSDDAAGREKAKKSADRRRVRST